MTANHIFPFTSHFAPMATNHMIVHAKGNRKPRRVSRLNQLCHDIFAKKCAAPAKKRK